MKILGSTWWGNIGVVKVELDGEIRLFIGTGYGFNQEADERKIANWGSSFNPNDLFFKTDH